MDKSNRNKIIISIILTLVLLIGGTYAVWTFLTEKTQITVLVDGDQISFDAGDSISAEGILPVDTPEEGIVKEIVIYKQNGDYTAGMDLYLKLTSWPTAFASSSFRWALYKNGNYLTSGTFLGTKQGNDVKLTTYSQKINIEEDKDIYKLYLWIESVSESSANMMNNSFTVNLYGKVAFYDGNDTTLEEAEPNAPELADGMIPIRYNYVIDEWEKADSTNVDNNWYDYYNKIWANAVLVTSESRSNYMNADVGTTINEDDVLAYYVWIPRYKYLLFNVNSVKLNPVEIQVVFEKTTDPISSGDENGEFLSHPAFWWDNDSNNVRASDGSEEVAGFWVGKYESNKVSDLLIIKPNMTVASTGTVKASFTLNKSIESITYFTEEGLSQIDAHMLKNTQWGAIAYLSSSKYGKNSNTGVSRNSQLISGRYSNYTYNDFVINNGNFTLTKKIGSGTGASTSGNVYGIYDMVGCIQEIVMAVRKTSGTDASPLYGSSGFNADTMPDSKYYDLYDYVPTSSNNDYSKRILGDATGETNFWYQPDHGTFSFFNSGTNGWLIRGAAATNTYATIVSSLTHAGTAANSGSRSVIVLP